MHQWVRSEFTFYAWRNCASQAIKYKFGFTVVHIIFLILLKKYIDCKYSLEPPRRGGSNEYSQSMFWAGIWKILEFFFLSEIFLFLIFKIFNIFESAFSWSWIREVEFGNSWSWNREFVKLKSWIRGIREVEIVCKKANRKSLTLSAPNFRRRLSSALFVFFFFFFWQTIS